MSVEQGTYDRRGHASRVRHTAIDCSAMSDAYLLFVWSPTGYSLRELDGELPHIGEEFDDDGRTIVINKIGRSPLPGDPRLRVLVRQGLRRAVLRLSRGVLGRREAEDERLREAARVAAGREAAGIDAGRPEAVDRAAVLAQHPCLLVDPQAADRVGDRRDHPHRLDRARQAARTGAPQERRAPRTGPARRSPQPSGRAPSRTAPRRRGGRTRGRPGGGRSPARRSSPTTTRPRPERTPSPSSSKIRA